MVLMVAAYVSINLIWMTQWTERDGWLGQIGKTEHAEREKERRREGIMNGWVDERMEDGGDG